MWAFIGVMLAVIFGSLLAYGFVFWVAWSIVAAFSQPSVDEPIVLGAIAIAASILCLAVAYVIAAENRK